MLLAVSPGFAPFFVLAIAGALALAIATVLDLFWGPSRRVVRVERLPVNHFALRVPAELHYAVENRSQRRIRAGVVEAPVRTLRFLDDEAIGGVPPASARDARAPCHAGRARFRRVRPLVRLV